MVFNKIYFQDPQVVRSGQLQQVEELLLQRFADDLQRSSDLLSRMDRRRWWSWPFLGVAAVGMGLFVWGDSLFWPTPCFILAILAAAIRLHVDHCVMKEADYDRFSKDGRLPVFAKLYADLWQWNNDVESRSANLSQARYDYLRQRQTEAFQYSVRGGSLGEWQKPSPPSISSS